MAIYFGEHRLVPGFQNLETEKITGIDIGLSSALT
jgi:hypothetical protein